MILAKTKINLHNLIVIVSFGLVPIDCHVWSIFPAPDCFQMGIKEGKVNDFFVKTK